MWESNKRERKRDIQSCEKCEVGFVCYLYHIWLCRVYENALGRDLEWLACPSFLGAQVRDCDFIKRARVFFFFITQELTTCVGCEVWTECAGVRLTRATNSRVKLWFPVTWGCWVFFLKTTIKPKAYGLWMNGKAHWTSNKPNCKCVQELQFLLWFLIRITQITDFKTF